MAGEAASLQDYGIDLVVANILPPARPPRPAPSEGKHEQIRAQFMDHLPHDSDLFNEYHALIVEERKGFCRKQKPLRPQCPLLPTCPSGQFSPLRP